MQCQSTEDCSFSEDFKRAARCHRDLETQPPVIVEPPVAESRRSLNQSVEPAVSEAVGLSLPVAEVMPETQAPPRRGAVQEYGSLGTEGQGIIAAAHGSHQRSSSRADAAAAAIEHPARGGDSGGSSPAMSGNTEKTRTIEKLLRIADGARPFRRPDGRYSVSIAVDGHQECHDLESPDVCRWLTRLYYESTGQLPSPSSLSVTIRALAAQADIARSAEADFVRVGCNESGTSIILDLGDSTWQAV